MDKEQRIRELALDMDFGCTKRDLYPDDAKEIAKALDILGYRKIVWHKVEDGDLPKEYHEVRFVINIGYHHNGVYKKETNAFYIDDDMKYDIDEVIAWTELADL